MNDVRITRDGTIDLITVAGEWDMSNVGQLDDVLMDALSDETTSCVLDLASVTFLDSSVVHALVRWSKETQVSEREALAIMVGGDQTPAARVLSLVGLISRLPVFDSLERATRVLREGQKSRPARSLRWLTALELQAEREEAQAGVDAANRRLDEARAEQDRRLREDEDPSAR